MKNPISRRKRGVDRRGKMSFGILGIIAGILVALWGQHQYDIYQQRTQTLLQSFPATPLRCTKIGEDLIPGPEDFTYSKTHNLLFISSHDRRDLFNATGALFVLHPDTGKLQQLDGNYPPYFRPHGIALFENCGSTDTVTLFVISHRFVTPLPNAIEKFTYTVSSGLLTHTQTFENELLVSPNDLLALNCDEILVSNDNFTPNHLLGLVSGAFKIRNSDLIHFDGQNWRSLNLKACYGNGLIIRQDPLTHQEYLIRSSSADYSLLTYAITRSPDGKLISVDRLVTDEKLPLSPDNIEEDVHTGDLIITGHPSLELVLSHAIFRYRVPSAAILYSSPGNYTTIYYNDGNELSASSVATRSNDKTLFVGQVFDSFMLACPQSDAGMLT
jgi:hypothetical protein